MFLDDVPEHIPINRLRSRQGGRARCRALQSMLAPGSGAKGVLVCASVQKCDCLQLLLNTEDFKLKKGNFRQKQGGHPGSLSLGYAIICWFRVMWKILHIFSDMQGKGKWHLSVLSQT